MAQGAVTARSVLHAEIVLLAVFLLLGWRIDIKSQQQMAEAVAKIRETMAAAAKVLNAIDKITSNIEVVVTVSADAADLPEDLKKFVV